MNPCKNHVRVASTSKFCVRCGHSFSKQASGATVVLTAKNTSGEFEVIYDLGSAVVRAEQLSTAIKDMNKGFRSFVSGLNRVFKGTGSMYDLSRPSELFVEAKRGKIVLVQTVGYSGFSELDSVRRDLSDLANKSFSANLKIKG